MVGAPKTLARVDARVKVRGEATYTEDLPLPQGVLACSILRSPYSHARIRHLNAEKAKQVTGIGAVLTRDLLGSLSPYKQAAPYGHIIEPPDQPFIAIDEVRFQGEPVAAVAAESFAIAQDAVEQIEVEYEELPAVFDVREAMEPGAPLVHPELNTNFVGDFHYGWGDVERGFRESDRVFEGAYFFPAVFHDPVENVGICIAEVRDGQFELLAPIQHLFNARREISTLFGVETEQIRIRMPYIGGSFGAKELRSEHLIALFLARETRRSVLFVPSAQESFLTTCRHSMVWKAKTGVKSDGTLIAQEITLLVDKGAYAHGGGATGVPVRAASLAWGPYQIPNLRIVSRSYYTNKVPAGSFRSLGRAQTTWGYESHYDMIARDLGIDPMEFRLKNFYRRGDRVAEGTGPFDSDLDDLLTRASRAIDWNGRSTRVGAQSLSPRKSSGRLRGKGMSVTFRHGYSGASNCSVTVTMNRTGVAHIQHTGTEIGQGIYNVLTRVAEQTLGIPRDQILVSHPDTIFPYFDGTASSRSTVALGKATERACEDLKQELLQVAANAKGGRAEDWRLERGRLCYGEQGFSFGEIVAAQGSSLVVMGKGSFGTSRYKNPWQGVVPHWELSAAAAEVEVDLDTGEVRLLQYANVADVGKAIDPVACEAQLDGGAVMGLGNTFYEEMVYGDGKMINGDPLQYRAPSLIHMPEKFLSFMVENGDGPGPFGAKGMGQTAVSPVAPAVANAIFEATGVRITDLPITAEKVLRSLGKL